MGRFCDLTGQKFGKLEVIRRAPNRGNCTMWECKCECGNSTIVSAGHLKNGHTQSCGCYFHEALSERNYKHGLSNQRLHVIWGNMKQRCLNPNNTKYDNYGGRGIKICDDWMNFLSFYEWSTTHGYRDDLTLDRIDVNGNYCPENCRWVTPEVQSLNRTDNHYLTFEGRTMTIKEWADEIGLSFRTLEARINRLKWPIEKALTEPLHSRKAV